MNVKYLNKELGTASGWDGNPGECFWFHNFVPNNDVELPMCEYLAINEDNATIHAQDKDGNNLQSWTIEWNLKPANLHTSHVPSAVDGE